MGIDIKLSRGAYGAQLVELFLQDRTGLTSETLHDIVGYGTKLAPPFISEVLNRLKLLNLNKP